MIEIKRWDTGEIIHSGEFADVRECLEDGVSKCVDFYRAELVGANLVGANLIAASLKEANLNKARLDRAKLNMAKLDGVSIKEAGLIWSSLKGANLPESSISIQFGEKYWLFISPQVVQAGFESHSPEDWRKMTEEDIQDMGGSRLVKFYPRLLDLMDFFLGEGESPDWASK